MSNSLDPDFKVEALAAAAADANQLDEDLRREIAKIVLEIRNPYHGELMGDKPPRVLKGCRKVRFDEAGWRRKPRYRLVYRNEPSDGAPATAVILAIGRRDRMIAYAKAAGRAVQKEIRIDRAGS
ncbi:MAG: hypothetical protein ACTHN3_12145 [Solirubrobacterales bacterium]